MADGSWPVHIVTTWNNATMDIYFCYVYKFHGNSKSKTNTCIYIYVYIHKWNNVLCQKYVAMNQNIEPYKYLYLNLFIYASCFGVPFSIRQT